MTSTSELTAQALNQNALVRYSMNDLCVHVCTVHMSEYVYACLHTLWIVGELFVDMCTQYVHKYIHMYICQCVASAFLPCLYHFEKPALREEPSNCLSTFTHIFFHFIYSDCTDFFCYIITLADTRR